MSDRGRRLRELVQAFLGRERAEPVEAELSSDVHEVEGWRRRLAAGGLIGRFFAARGPDQVTAAGEVTHLLVPVARFARLRASHRRVRVGEAVIHEGPLMAEDDVVMIRPEAPGCFEVHVDLLDAQGVRVEDGGLAPARLQVLGDEPVVVVDVELVSARPKVADELRRLHAQGVGVVYFDVADRDRTGELHEQLERWGAPAGAILAHAEDSSEVRTLGVDFRPVFLTATLCRLRGTGAPVVALASAGEVGTLAATRAGLRHFTSIEAAVEAAPSLLELARSWPRDTGPEGRLDRMTRTEAVGGNACLIELDNRLGRQRLFSAIAGSRRSVHLQYYMIRDGAFGDKLAAHLIRAARRGVRVRLMVDALYSIDGVVGATNAVARGLMLVPGIEVVSATPILTKEDLDPRLLKQRDHRKVVVVDDEVAFVGGRNACDEYYTGFDEVAITDWTPHGRIPWLDAHVEVQGPLVGAVARAFVSRWIEAGGREPAGGVEAVVDPPPVGRSRARLVLHAGVDDAAALLAYEALIDGAQRHVWIVNDFPIVPSLQVALRRALYRGVAVRVLTGSAVPRRADGSFFEGPLHREAFEFMTKKRLEGLMRAGVEVWEYVAPPHPLIVCTGGVVRPYVHAKVVSVDGRVVSVGSANLDATASYWEREANVVVEDPAVASELEARLWRMCDRGVRIDPQGDPWTREGILRDLASQLWPEALYS